MKKRLEKKSLADRTLIKVCGFFCLLGDGVAFELDVLRRVAEPHLPSLLEQSQRDRLHAFLTHTGGGDVQVPSSVVAPHVDVAVRSAEEPADQLLLRVRQLELLLLVALVERRGEVEVCRLGQRLIDFDVHELEAVLSEVAAEHLELDIRALEDLFAGVEDHVAACVLAAVALGVEAGRFGLLLLLLALGVELFRRLLVEAQARLLAARQRVAASHELHFDHYLHQFLRHCTLLMKLYLRRMLLTGELIA